MPRPPPSFRCPACGKEISPNARACPHCGADPAPTDAGHDADETDTLSAAGIDDPDDFDYDDFVRSEFGSGPRRPSFGWFWWAVAVVALVAFVLVFVVPLF